MSRVAVTMESSDALPIQGLPELEANLTTILTNPESPDAIIRPDVFESVRLQLTPSNSPPLSTRLLPQILLILLTYRHDTAPLCEFTEKLISPLTFMHILSHDFQSHSHAEVLVQALQSPDQNVALLALRVLSKATTSSSDTGIVAAMPNVVLALVKAWLDSPHVDVASQAEELLVRLLWADMTERPAPALAWPGVDPKQPTGQGLMFRRVFRDRQVYEHILASCTASSSSSSSSPATSLAQCRLLSFLVRASAMDLRAVTYPAFPDLNARYFGPESTNEGLLQCAALRMVDKIDALSRQLETMFWTDLLKLQALTPESALKSEVLGATARRAVRGDAGLWERVRDVCRLDAAGLGEAGQREWMIGFWDGVGG